MKVIKIHDGKLERARYFFIETDDGLMYFQRIDLFSAMDKPISYDEEIIIALCRRVQELESALKELIDKNESCEREHGASLILCELSIKYKQLLGK